MNCFFRDQHEALYNATKPYQYVGGEFLSRNKDFDSAKVRFAFVFPDKYEIAINNLGQKILYETGCYDGVYELTGKKAVELRNSLVFPKTRISSGEKTFYSNDKLYASLYQVKVYDADHFAIYNNAENTIVKSGVFFPLFYTGKILCYADGVKGIYTAENGSLIYFHSGVKAEK